MIDKIISLLAKLASDASDRVFAESGLVPALNLRMNEDELVQLLRKANPDMTVPAIPEGHLEDSPKGMVVRWTNNDIPRVAIRTDDGWAVVGELFDVSSAGFCELLTDDNVRNVQMIRPADNFLSPEDALAAICAANDLEVPSPLVDEKPEDEDEGDDEDEDSTSEGDNLTKVFRQMMEALSDGFVDVEDDEDDSDEDDEDIKLHPDDETSESFRRTLRNIPLGSEVSWVGKCWGYRVRKMTSTYWGVVDPDTHDRLDEDEAARWYYFNCGLQSVVDQGDFTGLGSGAINNGQLTRILQRPDVHSVYLHLS